MEVLPGDQELIDRSPRRDKLPESETTVMLERYSDSTEETATEDSHMLLSSTKSLCQVLIPTKNTTTSNKDDVPIPVSPILVIKSLPLCSKTAPIVGRVRLYCGPGRAEYVKN